MAGQPSPRRSRPSSRRRRSPTTSDPIATLRQAFGSGAARRLRPPTSRPLLLGSTTPSLLRRASWLKRLDRACACGLLGERHAPTPLSSLSFKHRALLANATLSQFLRRQLRGFTMAPRVLISDKLSPAAVAIFEQRGIQVDVKPGLEKDELAKIIGDYDGLAIRSATKVTAKLLEHATKLKVVGRAGIGVDNVDIPAATGRGVIVMNTPFGNSIPTADLSTQAGKWEKNRFMGVELTGKILGVIGCGNIGSIAASRGIGLRMRVIAYDPFLSVERAE